MPDVETAIRIEATGGDRAAAEIGKVSRGLQDATRSQEKLQAAGAKRDGQGLRILANAAGMVSGELGMAVSKMDNLVQSMQGAGAASQGLALGFGTLATGAGILAFAVFGLVKAHKDAERAAEEQSQKNLALIRSFDDAQKAGAKFSPTVQALMREMRSEETEKQAQRIRTLSAEVKALEERQRALNESISAGGRAAAFAAPQLRGVEQVLREKRQALVAATEGTRGFSEAVGLQSARSRKQAEDLKAARDALREYARSAEEAERSLRVAADPSQRLSAELEAIESERAAKELAARTTLREATDLDRALTDINREFAAKAQRAHREAAERSREAWMSATAGIQGAFVNLGVQLVTSMRGNTSSAQAIFRSFADAVIEELTRIAVRAAVVKIFAGFATGGAGLFFHHGGEVPGSGPKLATLLAGERVIPAGRTGYQFGGVVPGPEGLPRPRVVHGGERVVSALGLGDSGRGGVAVQVVNSFRGGIGGLDARSQREIARQMRRMIRSTGELGLA
jgi:hypothetical protein